MKTEAKKLTNALNRLKPIIGRRNTLPILSCVKIYAKNGLLQIEASNLDEHQIEQVECEGELKPCCADFGQLNAAIGGSAVEITLDKTTITIKCGYGTATLGVLDAEEFPALPKMGKVEKIGVSGTDLANSISKVAWAASTDEVRYMLQSVYIEGTAKMLSCVATNSRNLALIDLPAISATFKLVAPSNFVPNVISSLARDGAVLGSSESHISIEHSSGSYACKQIDGNYPNYRQAIPAKPKLLGAALVAELVDALSRCNFLADPSRNPVALLTFTKSGLEIRFTGKNSQLEMLVAGEFMAHDASMDAASFLTCLKAFKSESVKIYSNGADSMNMLILESENLFIYTCEMAVK